MTTSIRMRQLQAANLWPEWLPRDYTTFYQEYSKFVTYLAHRYNKVDPDIRDLTGHFWKELLRVDVLAKYVDALNSEVPKTATSKEACRFLRISMQEFSKITFGRRVYDHFQIKPVNGKTYNSMNALWNREDILALNKHVTEKGSFRVRVPAKDRSALPKTETVSMKDALAYLGIRFNQLYVYFWSGDLGYKDKNSKVSEAIRKLSLKPINGAKKVLLAVWDYEDIVNLSLALDLERLADLEAPPITLVRPDVSRPHFTGYLARAIHNIFKNYCRTVDRKHKERTGDCFPEFRPIPGDPKKWEDRLVAEEVCMEDQIELLRLAHHVQKIIPGCEVEVFDLIDEGCSLREAILKLHGLTNARKRVVLHTLGVGKVN